eukprot:3933543-Rhodomonas_salina.1
MTVPTPHRVARRSLTGPVSTVCSTPSTPTVVTAPTRASLSVCCHRSTQQLLSSRGTMICAVLIQKATSEGQVQEPGDHLRQMATAAVRAAA